MTDNAARKIEPAAPQKVVDEARPKEITVDLECPVQAFGNTLTKLTFRRPTGADLMALGDAYPIYVDMRTLHMRPNATAMGQMMSTLAQVPLKTIQDMDGEDFTNCSISVSRFFLGGVLATQ